MNIAFKPFAGFWKGVLVPSVGYDESEKMYEMKIDNNNCKEQLHIKLNKTELEMLIKKGITALLPNKEIRERNECNLEYGAISRIKNFIKEREEFIDKESKS